MKALILVSAFIATNAFAYTPTEAEKQCGKGVYCAEEMVCVGRIDHPPKGMHPDYFVEILTIKAFKATKNLGGGKKTLVDSLQMNNDPAGETPDITLEEAKAKAQFDYGNYGPPARVKGKTVTIPASSFDQGWTFTINSSEQRDGYRLDKLTGTMDTVGSVVPDYTTNYECEAKVVKAPSRIDDNTRD